MVFVSGEKRETMSDMMMFPKTVDEFMEKYKIVDSDEVYTNGAELVPIFRMKQWFEHVDTDSAKHGHWIFGETMGHSWMKCSECCISQSGQTLTFTYCPNCGAKMDEVIE